VASSAPPDRRANPSANPSESIPDRTAPLEQAPRVPSLRRRLVVFLLAAIAVTWVVTSLVGYRDARHEIDELLDAHLAQSASLLVSQVGHELEEIDVEHAPELHRYARRVAFQIWERGELRLHSQNAPNVRLSSKESGFSDTEAGGARWRVFSVWDARHRYLVQVAEERRVRERIAIGAARNQLVPLLVALPVLGLLVWLAVTRGMRPLVLLSGEVARRDPDMLAPLPRADAPAEVRPLIDELNALFGRVASSIENERRFTADAAHELRTPLAAVRAQAQVARGASDDQERRRALDGVIAGCDRAAHLVAQLLTLARLDPQGFFARSEPCDLADVVRASVAELASQALARRIDIGVDAPAAAPIDGDPLLLAVLVRNLVDNAIRYSDAGTAVTVSAVFADAAGTRLEVADQGRGVAAEALGRLGQRFFRADPGSESGSGLGLAIVRRICELHRARLSIGPGSQGRGLTVTVIFPRASPVRGSSKAGAH
jgi:two-component system sensor histidine kinase QseC